MPENLNLSIESLNIHADLANNNHWCEIFKVYPEAKEKFGGYLFGIIEINATPRFEAEKIYQIVFTTLKENYYQQISSSPDPTKLNLEAIFEFALNKVNQRLIELIEIGQIKLIIDNFHYFIGIIKPENTSKNCSIIFTNRGNLHAHLIHQPLHRTPQIINILDSNNQPLSTNDKMNFFSLVSSGFLPQNDVLVISTEILQNLIAPNKLLNIIINNSFSQAIDYLRTITKQVRNDSPLTYGLIAFKYAQAKFNNEQPISQQSINEFIDTTERTKKLLTPSFTLNIKQNFKKIIHLLLRKLYLTKQKNNDPIRSSDPIMKKIYHLVLSSIQHLFKFIPGKNISMPNNNPSLNTTLDKSWLTGKFLSVFTNKRMIILTSILIIAILTVGSIYWANQLSIKKQNEKVYTAQLSKVKTIINEAESSYIYRDNNKSIAKLQEATKELSYLPQSTNIQQTNYRDLEKSINDLRNKILNIEKVVPQLLTELTIEGQPLNHNQLAFVENRLFVFGNNNTIAEINIEKKTIAKTYTGEAPLVRALGDNQNQYFIDNQNFLYKINNQQLTKYSGQIANHQDAKFYNGNIYTLSNIAEQIIKYRPTDETIGEPQNWIYSPTNTNLTTATALAIDGSIYTLNSNGEIQRFYSGKNENFTNPAIEPIITNAQKIFTGLGNDNLYIFEAKTKRLIIIKKTGQLIKQIVFDSLPSISDLEMNSDFTSGYILTENKIYQFNLE